MSLNYDQLAEEALGGGFTTALDGSRPTFGYAVALHSGDDAEIRLDSRVNVADAIYVFVIDHGRELRGPGAHLGAWRDGDRIVLDVVTVEQDRANALYRARARQQDAIFDLAHGQEIPVEVEPLGSVELDAFTAIGAGYYDEDDDQFYLMGES